MVRVSKIEATRCYDWSERWLESEFLLETGLPYFVKTSQGKREGDAMTKKRILTGDRPTGRLHLGHFVGSLKNRVRLQDEYECYFIIADLHTLTTRPEKTGELAENIRQLVLDYLSVGIDPEKATTFRHSSHLSIRCLPVSTSSQRINP